MYAFLSVFIECFLNNIKNWAHSLSGPSFFILRRWQEFTVFNLPPQRNTTLPKYYQMIDRQTSQNQTDQGAEQKDKKSEGKGRCVVQSNQKVNLIEFSPILPSDNHNRPSDIVGQAVQNLVGHQKAVFFFCPYDDAAIVFLHDLAGLVVNLDDTARQVDIGQDKAIHIFQLVYVVDPFATRISDLFLFQDVEILVDQEYCVTSIRYEHVSRVRGQSPALSIPFQTLYDSKCDWVEFIDNMFSPCQHVYRVFEKDSAFQKDLGVPRLSRSVGLPKLESIAIVLHNMEEISIVLSTRFKHMGFVDKKQTLSVTKCLVVLCGSIVQHIPSQG